MPPYSGRILPKLEGEERTQALAEPGPTWSQWFFYSFAKVWTILAFLILDVFLLTAFGAPFLPWALFPSLALAVYAEYLLYQYLWHRPGERPRSTGEPFRRTWHHPVAYGRWTIEAERAKIGLPAVPMGEEPHPDPSEFL